MKIKNQIESFEETVQVFISHCFKNNQVRSINPYFDEIYIINKKNYKFTQDVLDAMINTEKVKVLNISADSCNIIGIENTMN